MTAGLLIGVFGIVVLVWSVVAAVRGYKSDCRKIEDMLRRAAERASK